jgi:predicted O-methyltransferase YrrM
MRLTKLQMMMLAAGLTMIFVVGAVSLGWWQVAVAAIAVLQATTLVAVIDTRSRMARATAVRAVSKQLDRVRRVADNVGTRMLSVAETSRVETADQLSEMRHLLGESRVAGATVQKELGELATGVDAWRSQLDGWHDDLVQLTTMVSGLPKRLTHLEGEIHHDQRELERRLGTTTSRQIRQTEALIQLYDRMKPRSPMPSSGGWALDATAILTLLELVERVRPQLVLELGSGTSTIWLGYALERLGSGRLIAIDHLAAYAERTQENVRAHGLDAIIDVRTAPLVDSTLPGHETPWYDHGVFADLMDIDLLFVDGPPKGTGPKARYPALAKLARQLSPTAAIALDDADRQDEKEVVQLWCSEYPQLRVVPVSPGDPLKVLLSEPLGAQ